MASTNLLILFVLFIIIYTIIIEIFTVLFRMTGVTKEKARTQVISLLTNCGFTTTESEIILSSKRRRKLAQATMICGYSFSVVIVSVLVNLFLELKQSEVKSLIEPVIYLLSFTTAIFLFMRLESVRAKFDYFIERISNRIMFGKKSNILILIDIYHKKAMVEVMLDNMPTFLNNIPLSQTHLKELYDIQILFIRRNNETLSSIDGHTTLHAGDTLVLFGDYKNIKSVFEHPDCP